MMSLRHQQPVPLNGVDPRVRLLGGLLLLLLVVSSTAVLFPCTVAAICLPAALGTGMRLRLLFLRLLQPLMIAGVLLVLKTFFGHGEPAPVFTVGATTLMGHPSGLTEGTIIAARIVGAVSVAILLGRLMTFTEAMASLGWLRVPRGIVDVALFSWRALFMLYEDALVVYTAQRNRLGYCGLRRSVRSFGTMAGMLTIRAFDGSQALTTAMSQRGYDGTLPLLNESRVSRAQIFILLMFTAVTVLAWRLQN